MTQSNATSPKLVGIWVRVSTEDQVRGESPQHHELRARTYAESKGWSVVSVYRLDGVSGKDVPGHAECLRMRQDVERGLVQALIVSKVARLARSAIHLLELSDFFQKHNVHLVSLAEHIDTTTPHGRAQYGMIATFAQWEREEIAERVNDAIVWSCPRWTYSAYVNPEKAWPSVIARSSSRGGQV